MPWLGFIPKENCKSWYLHSEAIIMIIIIVVVVVVLNVKKWKTPKNLLAQLQIVLRREAIRCVMPKSLKSLKSDYECGRLCNVWCKSCHVVLHGLEFTSHFWQHLVVYNLTLLERTSHRWWFHNPESLVESLNTLTCTKELLCEWMEWVFIWWGEMLWFADWSNPVGCKQFPPGSSSVCRVHWSETWDCCWPNRARSACKGLGGGDDQSVAAIVGSCCKFVIRT